MGSFLRRHGRAPEAQIAPQSNRRRAVLIHCQPFVTGFVPTGRALRQT